MHGKYIKEARRKGKFLIKITMKYAPSDLNIDSDHIVELENNVQYIHNGTSELEVSAIIIC